MADVVSEQPSQQLRDIAREEAARACSGLCDIWTGFDVPEVHSIVHLAAERVVERIVRERPVIVDG
jgi:hypothetical protein